MRRLLRAAATALPLTDDGCVEVAIGTRPTDSPQQQGDRSEGVHGHDCRPPARRKLRPHPDRVGSCLRRRLHAHERPASAHP